MITKIKLFSWKLKDYITKEIYIIIGIIIFILIDPIGFYEVLAEQEKKEEHDGLLGFLISMAIMIAIQIIKTEIAIRGYSIDDDSSISSELSDTESSYNSTSTENSDYVDE